jgi:hypothetical protein
MVLAPYVRTRPPWNRIYSRPDDSPRDGGGSQALTSASAAVKCSGSPAASSQICGCELSKPTHCAFSTVTRTKKIVPPLDAGDLYRPPAFDSAQQRQASAAESGSPQIKQPPSRIPLRS